MCYDISFTVNVKALSDYFPELRFDDQIEMTFQPTHIAGHSFGNHPIIYRHREDGELHCRLMEWGCIPFYVKEEDAYRKQRATMLNARSERILNDPKSYWHKIRNRRCLVPVTGFYEHREVKGIKNKIPYFISMKTEPLFFLPGLYSVAELLNKESAEIEKRYTFAVVTTAANDIMAQIHNGGENNSRMPLLLPFEKAREWLEEPLDEVHYNEILSYNLPGQQLQYHTVFTIRGGKMRPDNKEKNEPYLWDGVDAIKSDNI